MAGSVFNERLKMLRVSNGITQTKLAELLGITSAAYNLYETQGMEPNYRNLKRLANIFNVSTDYLLGVDVYDEDVDTSESAYRQAKDKWIAFGYSIVEHAPDLFVFYLEIIPSKPVNTHKKNSFKFGSKESFIKFTELISNNVSFAQLTKIMQS